MIFKIDSLKTEFDSPQVSSYLKSAFIFLDYEFKRICQKELHVTNILRSVNSQILICEGYHLKSDFQHCLGEALDISVLGVTPDQQKGLIEIADNLNKICKLAVHSKGTAPHLHLNTVGVFQDKVKLEKLLENPNVKKNYTGTV